MKQLLDREVVITNIGRETFPKDQTKHLFIDASNFMWQVLGERPVPEDHDFLTQRDHTGLTDATVLEYLEALGFELNRTILTNGQQQISQQMTNTSRELTWEEFLGEFPAVAHSVRSGQQLHSFAQQHVPHRETVKIQLSNQMDTTNEL